jgi:hypothetical protein
MIPITSFFSLKRGFKALLLICILTGISQANASHMAGADISYEFLGNDQYKVSYTLYSDCSGSLPPVSMNASVRSNNCSFSQSFVLQKVIGSEVVISTNCTSAPSTCNGGMNAGFKQIDYSGTFLLQQKCSDIIFSVTDCCRNSAITSIHNPDTQPLYVEATLNNVNGENSSPVFSGKPIMVLNTNQQNQLSANSTDIDGDSLVYSLVAPRTSELTQVNYVSGYDEHHFIATNSDQTINSQNGTIGIIPSQQETAILAIKVSEFRNGELIGSTMRDIQVISANSSNTLPTIPQLDTNPLNLFSVCLGEELLINLSSVDIDAGQSTVIDITSNIPDLNIDRSIDRLQQAQLTWTAKSLPGNQALWITVVVSDNACPMNGTKTYFLEVHVSQLEFSPAITNSDCAGKDNGSVVLNVSEASQPVTIHWIYNNATTPALSDLAAGVYAVTIDNGKGCRKSRTFQIDNNEKIELTATIQKATCNDDDGIIGITAIGGKLPYSFLWDDNSDLQNRTDLQAGLYTIQVIDQIGCKINTTLKVEQHECESKNSAFNLFPNPAAESITIQNDFLESAVQSISISDASGRIIRQKDLFKEGSLYEKIDIENIAQGLYFVSIISKNDKTVLPFIKK